ncbi:tigger transposable element-derived protein 6, partial [Biomphalaria glabrata]
CHEHTSGKNMRKQWTAVAMAAAVTAVRNKEMGYLKASKTFGVPRATLERKVKCIDTPLSEVVNVPLGRKPTLPLHIEADLVDEKGITTVQSNNAKIKTLKGKKQIGVLSSAERGRTVTTVICRSAAGEYVPPMLIFPRQRMKMELMDGAPPGSIYACHKTGWIQLDLFTQWLQHFINFVKPSLLNPALLILDGHASHTKNLDAINLARQKPYHNDLSTTTLHSQNAAP